MVIAQMLGNRQVHDETFGSDGKISEKTWEGMGQEHQDLLGSREAVQKKAQGARDILHNGLLDVVERITTQIEKSTDFHHHREGDGQQTLKWLLKLKDVETKPVPGKGIDDDVLHSESVQHVQLDGDDTHWFKMLIRLLIRTWPELDGQQIWDLSVVATHGLLGAHSDEPLHDGPGDSVVSVSIQGHGAGMSFHKDITTPSSLEFSLQHADIVKFSGNARYNMVHQIDLPGVGTTTTTNTTSTEYTHYSHANHFLQFSDQAHPAGCNQLCRKSVIIRFGEPTIQKLLQWTSINGPQYATQFFPSIMQKLETEICKLSGKQVDELEASTKESLEKIKATFNRDLQQVLILINSTIAHIPDLLWHTTPP
jgi:hypothetical protein